METHHIPITEHEAWFLDDLLTARWDDEERVRELDCPTARLVRDQVGEVLLHRRVCLQVDDAQLDYLRKVVPSSVSPLGTDTAKILKLKLHFEFLHVGRWEQLGIS